MSLNVLFINPAREGKGNIPLNIPILISIAKQNNCNVRLLHLEDYPHFQSTVSEDDTGQFMRVHNSLELQLHFDEIRKRHDLAPNYLRKGDPLALLESIFESGWADIIAVSSLSTDFPFITEILSGLKKKHGGFLVIGGIHAILCDKDVQAKKVYDVICYGEGEKVMEDLIRVKKGELPLSSVGGIFYMEGNGDYKKTPPQTLSGLDAVPQMDFDEFLPIHFYRPFKGKLWKMVNYEMSRGCPFKCSYCANVSISEKYRGLGKYHRSKSIGVTIKELRSLIDKYRFNFVRFWDEDFTCIQTEHLQELAEEYKREIALPFMIYSRAESISERKVELLKDMGCVTFAMGIESGNEWIRRNCLNRNISNEKLIEKFQLVKKHKIRVSAYNMIGLPFETRERIFDTIEVNRRCETATSSVVFLEPYKNTPIRAICEKEGLVDPSYDPQYNRFDPHFVPTGMTKEELVGLIRTFHLYVALPKEYWSEIEVVEKHTSAMTSEIAEKLKRLNDLCQTVYEQKVKEMELA